MEEIKGPLKDRSVEEKTTILIFNHISNLIQDTNDKRLKEELTALELKELNESMQ